MRFRQWSSEGFRKGVEASIDTMDNDEVNSLVDLTEGLNIWRRKTGAVGNDADENNSSSHLGAAAVGKFLAPKVGSLKLLTSILRRLWWNEKDWRVKILDKKAGSFIVGVEFQSLAVCSRMVDKGPWVFNGEVLLLEHWPSRSDARIVNSLRSNCGSECCLSRQGVRVICTDWHSLWVTLSAFTGMALSARS